jgi:hypothetical protein
VKKGFTKSERGRLIMACGTGKTYTSLKMVEEIVPIGGSVLFLVPSLGDGQLGDVGRLPRLGDNPSKASGGRPEQAGLGGFRC